MSRRTAESNKAILAAWNKEQELVQEGKGTREWTPEQQQDILEKGKAYDEYGVAFQGQHMKSAEMYPEYQGDPGNIQFLTRAEHLEAHDGNWKNSTNWYFNPVTKEKIIFGDGPFIPCKQIKLSKPIINIYSSKESKSSKMSSETDKNKVVNIKPTISSYSNENIITKIKKRLGKIEDFSNRHPIITNIIKKTIAIAIEVTLDSALNGTHSQKKGCNHSSKHKYTPKDSNSNIFIYEKKSCEIPLKSQYTANDVPAGKQRYHYKDGSVLWKEKAPYHRSGKKV